MEGFHADWHMALRLPWMLQVIFQDRVLRHRQSEYDRLRAQREEQIRLELQTRKQQREIKRKKIYFLMEEEKRCQRILEEEEARKHEGMWISILESFPSERIRMKYRVVKFI